MTATDTKKFIIELPKIDFTTLKIDFTIFKNSLSYQDWFRNLR